MRFAIVLLVVMLGATAVSSAPSNKRTGTTHLMKKLLAQLLTRGSDSSDSQGLSMSEETLTGLRYGL